MRTLNLRPKSHRICAYGPYSRHVVAVQPSNGGQATARSVRWRTTEHEPGGTGVQAQSDATLATGSTPDLGTFLIDPAGMTLYMYTKDDTGTSNFYQGCAAAWPPLLTQSARALPADLPEAIGTTTRTDGTLQVTYNGMPLYYWASDQNPVTLRVERGRSVVRRESVGAIVRRNSGTALASAAAPDRRRRRYSAAATPDALSDSASARCPNAGITSAETRCICRSVAACEYSPKLK
jgi:predicted lipoprotein with Yx(FWY)xxD motif